MQVQVNELVKQVRAAKTHMGHLRKKMRSKLTMQVQVNEFVKRVRAAKIHILIMGHLRKKMPAMMGKQKAQEKLLANLQQEFGMVQREYHLPAGKTAFLLPTSHTLACLPAYSSLEGQARCIISDTLSNAHTAGLIRQSSQVSWTSAHLVWPVMQLLSILCLNLQTETDAAEQNASMHVVTSS